MKSLRDLPFVAGMAAAFVILTPYYLGVAAVERLLSWLNRKLTHHA